MSDMDKRRSALIFAISVSILWGLSFLSTKVAVAGMPPMTLALARFVVAVVLLLALALGTHENLCIKLRDTPILALGGISGVTFYFLCENNGIALLTASESSMFIATIPVLTMLVEPKIALQIKENYVGHAYHLPHKWHTVPVPRNVVVNILRGKYWDNIWREYKEVHE